MDNNCVDNCVNDRVLIEQSRTRTKYCPLVLKVLYIYVALKRATQMNITHNTLAAGERL